MGIKLYKNRYLIAIYDRNDRFVACGTSLYDFKDFKANTVYHMLRENRFGKYRAYLIDCLQPHEDVFAEEDKLFLACEEQFCEEQRLGKKTELFKMLAKERGVSLRTIWRRYKMGVGVFECLQANSKKP